MDNSSPSDVQTLGESWERCQEVATPPDPSSAETFRGGGDLPQVSIEHIEHDQTRTRVLASMFGELEPESTARYQRIRALGRGAMGRVDLAKDIQLDRLVALKTITPERADDSRARARIEQEARALAQIDHPNVVAIYDVLELDEGLTLSMEFIEGQTLREWLEAKPCVDERLEKLCAVAAGLAAAHQQGIVHRDVKPDNIIVIKDGGLKVVDFGLARSSGSDQSADGEAESTAVEDTDSISFDSPKLTRTGAVLGTPAYMAPEQFVSGIVDARSDQFALCVMIFEALSGQRPFAGQSPQTIAANIVAGRIDGVLLGSIPKWLRPALRRGLQASPEARFDKLDDLRVAIDPKRHRRRVQISVLSPLALLIAGVGINFAGSQAALAPPDPCRQAGAELSAEWNEAQREQLSAHFVANAPAYGAELASAVNKRLDLWTSAWGQELGESCKDTHHDKSQSMATYERSARCFDQALLDFRSLRGQLTTLEDPENAMDMLHGLATLERCRDLDALESAWSDPEDPELAKSAHQARAGLSDVRALQLAGKHEQAQVGLATIREFLPSGRLGAVDAEIELARGIILLQLGKHEKAERALLDATRAAEASRHDEIAAKAWQRLVSLAANTKLDAERAQFYLERADAALLRVGDPIVQRIHLRRQQALTHLTAGRIKEAEAIFEALIVDAEARLPAGAHSENLLGDIEYGLGRIYYRRHNIARARELFASALRRHTQTRGTGHPETLDAKHNLGSMMIAEGNLKDGIALLERTRDQRIAIYGEHHDKVAGSINSIASAHYTAGDYEKALADYRRALAIHKAVNQGPHPLTAGSLSNLGRCLSRLGRHDEADAAFAEAVQILEAKLGKEHESTAEALGGWASAMVEAERLDEALAVHVRVIEMRRTSLGPEAPYTLISEYNAAEVERELGYVRSAKGRLKRILAAESLWPTVRIHALLLRGWLAADEGDVRAAKAAFGTAIEEREDAGSDANLAEALSKAEAWLAEH